MDLISTNKILESLSKDFFSCSISDIKNHALLANLKITDEEIIRHRAVLKHILEFYKECSISENYCNSSIKHIQAIRDNENELQFQEYKCSKNNIVEQQKKSIYCSNEITRKPCYFTLEEQKIIYLIINQIIKINDEQTVFKISKKQFFDCLQLSSPDKYKRYKTIIHNLIGKTYCDSFLDIDGGEITGSIISSAKWHNKKTYFEVGLTKWFIPHIKNLTSHYTKLDLSFICNFDSKYTLTIYKLVASWVNGKKIKLNKVTSFLISDENLKKHFLLLNKYQKNGSFDRKTFELKTLDIAATEINKKTNLNVSYVRNIKDSECKGYLFEIKKTDK